MIEYNQQTLSRVVRRLLRPVIAFCLRRSLRLREIFEIIKVILVELAIDELRSNNETLSVTRVALMTGVHRKDVTELLKQQTPRQSSDTVFIRIIGHWRTDRRFSKNGRPRPLSHVGLESEFARLVRAVNRELTPYSVLFELNRMGIVTERDGKLELVSSEFVPLGKLDERFSLVSQDVDDLVRAAEENILIQPQIPNLHLSTTYDNVSVEELPRIRQWFMQQGAQLHERARSFLSALDGDINPELSGKPGGGRVVIGTFSFVQDPKKEREGLRKKKEGAGRSPSVKRGGKNAKND